MGKIIQYLLHYTRDFKWKFYLVFISFLVVSVFINYQFEWWDGRTMQNYFVIPTYDTWLEPFAFGFFHAFPYLIAIVLLKIFKYPIKLPLGFWLSFLFGLFLISTRRGTDFYQELSILYSYKEWRFLSRVFYNLYTLVLMFIPLWIGYKLYYKKRIGHWYFRSEWFRKEYIDRFDYGSL